MLGSIQTTDFEGRLLLYLLSEENMVSRDFVLRIIFNMNKNASAVCYFPLSVLFVKFHSFY